MAGHAIVHIPELRATVRDPRFLLIALGGIFLAVFPLLGHWAGETYLISLVAKMMIFAIAAASLDLILGYGGMVSFGHAAYLGLGAYAVAVWSKYGVDNGYLQLLCAIGGSALVALGIGAISLRTSGVYFIMITLAFTQMLYYLGISLEPFGGDDGMNTARSDLGIGLPFCESLKSALGLSGCALVKFTLNTNVLGPAEGDRDGIAIYYAAFVFLVATIWFLRLVVNSRFGMVVRGAMSNPVRMQAIGFPIYRYRLAAFVLAGMVCGISGFLFANHQQFLSPVYMNWLRSGEIMVMVILGGMGTIYGAVIGAIGFLTAEEVLEQIIGKDYWQMMLGILLVVLVLFARSGLYGLTPHRQGPIPTILRGFAYVIVAALLVWGIGSLMSRAGLGPRWSALIAFGFVTAAIMALYWMRDRMPYPIPRICAILLGGVSGFATYVLLLNVSSSIGIGIGRWATLSPLHLIMFTLALILVVKLVRDLLEWRRSGAAAKAGHG